MAKHRVSFWRTTVASAAAMFALTALMIGLLAWGWSATPYWATYLGLALAVILIMPLAAVSGLIAAGGLIALQRDLLEAVGQPYAQSSPREAASTFIVPALRALLGSARLGLCPGDDVEVRPLGEILQTLDDKRKARRLAVHAGDGGLLRQARPRVPESSTS